MALSAAVVLRRTAAAAGAALGLFHVWLFVRHALDGGLWDPERLARWLIAAGVAAALVGLNRRGVSIVRGRRAVALWIVAALLHGPAVARAISASDSVLPEIVATLVQTAAASGAAFVLLLVGLARWRRLSASKVRSATHVLTLCIPRWLAGGDTFVLAAPRPPPSA